jgi:DNA-binding PadR family transcriptional regulator
MVKYALLGLLREHRDYGYQLKRRFDERLGSLWRLNSGQIYQTLRSLTRSGLVEEVRVAEADGGATPLRPRRIFELTPKGERVLDRWLARPPGRSRPVRDETLLRLLVMAPERHAEAAAQIERLLHLYRQQSTRLLAAKRKLPKHGAGPLLVQELGLEAALLHTEAHIRWLEFTRQRLIAAGASE